MDKEEVRKLITGLKVWKRGDQRAPHKPLLLLYALGRCLRGEDRLMSYEIVDKDLKKLLLEFGPPRKSFHPEYPFWRLQSDGLWEIPDAEKFQKRKSSIDIPRSALFENSIRGGFREDVQQVFEQYSIFPAEGMRLCVL